MVEIAGFELGLESDPEYYHLEENVKSYEEKRYKSPGGSYIDSRNREWVRELFGEEDWEGRPLEGEKVLVSAGGTGRMARYIGEAGADVVCLDLSRRMLEEGREEGKGDVKYVQADARNLPFRDDLFDRVVSLRSAHVIGEGLEDYVDELGRVSERGVLMDTFTAPSLRSIYNPILKMDSTLYSDTEIEEVVEEADHVSLGRKKEEFVLPYAAFLLSGNIPWLNNLVKPVSLINHSLESLDLTDHISSVTVWELESET